MTLTLLLQLTEEEQLYAVEPFPVERVVPAVGHENGDRLPAAFEAFAEQEASA